MKDREAISLACSRGWCAFLPKSGWRKVEGGFFYPNENQFGEVFARAPENPTAVRHRAYMYEIGRYERVGKKMKWILLGQGMTWEEAFAAIKEQP